MKMELKDALQIAIDYLENTWISGDVGRAKHRQAARLLRENKSAKVEQVEEIEAQKCSRCGLPNTGCYTSCMCGKHLGFSRWENMVKWRKTYTTHHEIKIIEVTSEPTFVEIGGKE